jgi:hypothetical protein
VTGNKEASFFSMIDNGMFGKDKRDGMGLSHDDINRLGEKGKSKEDDNDNNDNENITIDRDD